MDDSALKIYRLHELSDLLGVSSRTIYNLIDVAGFPKPVLLSERLKGWRHEDVERWLASRPQTN